MRFRVARHRGVRPWLVHAAFALVVSRIPRGTCRSRATPSLYTRTRATRPRRVPFRLFVLGARSSAQRQEHSLAIVRTCRRARFGLRRLRSGAATAFGQTTRAQQPECDRACAWAYRICRGLTFTPTGARPQTYALHGGSARVRVGRGVRQQTCQHWRSLPQRVNHSADTESDGQLWKVGPFEEAAMRRTGVHISGNETSLALHRRGCERLQQSRARPERSPTPSDSRSLRPLPPSQALQQLRKRWGRTTVVQRCA